MLKHNDSGNALFLILIAVALFAALSYAVTQSGRGGGGIDRETTALSASQLVQYSSLASSVITRMQIVNGCSDTEFSFERAPFDGTDAAYVNSSAPGDFSCHFYHPNGGNMVEFDPDTPAGLTEATSEVEFYGSTLIPGAGTFSLTPESIDLSFILRNINENACAALNRGIGIDGIPGDTGDLDVVPFTGTYTVTDGIDGCFDVTAGACVSPDDSPWAGGIPNACFREDVTGNFIYFHVMIPR